MKDLVSVIIPTYKRDCDLLKRAIDSVFNQTYKNIEVIVVEDNAGAVLKSYRTKNIKMLESISQKHKALKIVLNKVNLGGALSRNEGIKNACGKFVTFLDDDDEFCQDKIKNQIQFMLNHELNCSFTDLSIYNEYGKLIDRRIRNDIKSFDKKNLIKYHLTKMITGTETFMVARDLLINIGGFDDAIMGQEFFLMYKILNYENLKIGYFESDDIKAYRTDAEAISTGPNKIKGEKLIYDFKKEHFNLLNHKEKNYVKCRHRAVMAVAYFRNKRYIKGSLLLLFSFITNPFTSINEAIKLKNRTTILKK